MITNLTSKITEPNKPSTCSWVDKSIALMIARYVPHILELIIHGAALIFFICRLLIAIFCGRCGVEFGFEDLRI